MDAIASMERITFALTKCSAFALPCQLLMIQLHDNYVDSNISMWMVGSPTLRCDIGVFLKKKKFNQLSKDILACLLGYVLVKPRAVIFFI